MLGKPGHVQVPDLESGRTSGRAESVLRTKCSPAKLFLQQSPARLDGVEVRGVWRKELQPGADGTDVLGDLLGMMSSKVVEDDNVAGAKSRTEPCSHPLPEALLIHRLPAGGEDTPAIQGDGAGHRELVPVAGWLGVDKFFPPGDPGMRSRHRRVGSCLVQKDKTSRIDSSHPASEATAFLYDVWPRLLCRPAPFFLLT